MTDNVATIRSAFTAFAQGDLETLKKVFSPEIVWREPGRGSISGEYRGLDATLAFFGQLFELSGGTFKAQLLECGEIAPDHVVCLINASGDMDGRRLDQRAMLMFNQRGGRTVEVQNFSSDQYAQDAFWGTGIVTLPDTRKAKTPLAT